LAAGSQGGGQEWLDAHSAEGMEGMVSYDEATTKEWITPYQIKKAAWVVKRLGDYRLMLQRLVFLSTAQTAVDGVRGEVTPESTKAGSLCMAQYQKYVIPLH
jgi:carnitine O-acetyltransferase